MDEIKFICECCGEEHVSWPALTFNSPNSYHNLSEQEKEEIAVIDQDFCVIKYSDQEINLFIRCVLIQKVNDHCEDLEYGFWVSLSETSFKDYLENFDNENHETQYFGSLSNYISQYQFSNSIPTTVVTKSGNDRPEIFPHQDFDHPFVKDYYEGITKEEAEKRISEMLKN